MAVLILLLLPSPLLLLLVPGPRLVAAAKAINRTIAEVLVLSTGIQSKSSMMNLRVIGGVAVLLLLPPKSLLRRVHIRLYLHNSNSRKRCNLNHSNLRKRDVHLVFRLNLYPYRRHRRRRL